MRYVYLNFKVLKFSVRLNLGFQDKYIFNITDILKKYD